MRFREAEEFYGPHTQSVSYKLLSLQDMSEIEIKSAEGVLSHIFVGSNIADVLHCLDGFAAVYVVCDANVDGFADIVAQGMGAKCRGKLVLQTSETSKNLNTIADICAWLLENGADRKALVLAVGGGIISDMTGFAASIYKRGVRFAYIPTTLLAQVDAAIGGKTGVNFENFKNILGVIRQPEFTYLCPEVLQSLPYRAFLSGAAEMVKSFIIENAYDNYAKAMGFLHKVHDSRDKANAIAENLETLEDLIAGAARVKAGVVGRDQYEQGERMKLNLGHTFAHAIEWKANSVEPKVEISHGEAVAMGMVLAARASDILGLSKGLETRIKEDFAACGLPTETPFLLEELGKGMSKDKKADGGKIHFVLMEEIGKVVIRDMSVEEMLALLDKD